MAALAGVGLATSLGTQAPSVCAAIRAGVVRPRAIEGTVAFDGEQPDDAAVIGHPAPDGLTDGYQVPARWMRLMRAAVVDAVRPEGVLSGPRSALWLCLPAEDPARFEDGLPEPRWFQQRIPGAWGPWGQAPVVIMAGAAGFWATLSEACQRVDRRELNRAIIVAADSYLDEQSLRWLSAAGRLKTPGRPSGVAPGEAGACLILEREGDLAVEPPGWSAMPAGKELQHAWKLLESAIRDAVGRAVSRPLANVVGNHNGEEGLAYAWAMAQSALRARGPRIGDAQRFPAASVGDVGLCAPALGLAVARASYQRKYAAPGATLVWSLDGGTAGACVVEATGGESR